MSYKTLYGSLIAVLVGTLVVLLLVIGFFAIRGIGQGAILTGVLRDQIYSVEPRENGATIIWMRHDDVGTYCSFDPVVVAKINQIFDSDDPDAFIGFRTINFGEAEAGGALNLDPKLACPSEADAHTRYLITDVWTPDEFVAQHKSAS